ncbi:MAG TPA: biotin--[acetyl-CoA-carboxylase] ligase [Candidatus Brachybacterium merdavium]|uniref:biotin--[biotin carboxyl-carrier protein] ligase n=1 Tax=Candidatus Brachybacterium merdavium TaxID=2838513 RepID=A0A9D2RQ81_9MICO|nr:biotin--[acetyl-CoA-carboxylase] ligase [Candidatus Brachybacterium merdavium]
MHGPTPGQPGPMIHRLDAVASTQDEAAAHWDGRQGHAAAPVEAPFAILAREQTAGRGRLGRRFVSPPGGALALTVAHRSAVPPAARSWFPLAAGLAVIDTLSAVLGPAGSGGAQQLGLKWPNDIHTVQGRKLGGILVEGHGMDGVLVGIGLNLLGPIREADGGAVPGATWLLGPEGILGREAASTTEVDELRELIGTYLARAVTRELEALESTEGDAQDAGTHRRYTMTCLTLGSAVRVDRLDPAEAGGTGSVHGTARAIDAHGRLVVDLEGGRSLTVDVGDVRHLRPGRRAGTAEGIPTVAQQEEKGT